MFIKVTRSAAVSALAAGQEVRIDATGELLQLNRPYGMSKRACRRMLSRWSCWFDSNDQIVQTTFSVLIRD